MVIGHESGLVDEDVTLAEIGRQPADLLHGHLHLGDLGVIAFADHGAHGRAANHAIRLQAVFALERLHQVDEIRRIIRRLLIGGNDRRMLGLEGGRSAMFDGLDDIGHIRAAVAGLQHQIGGNAHDMRCIALAAQAGKFGLQRKIFGARRFAAAQIGGDIGAEARKLQHGCEVHRLALEIMVAGKPVRIDTATGRILHIGKNLGGERKFELHLRPLIGVGYGCRGRFDRRTRCSRAGSVAADAGGHVLCRCGNAVIGRIEATFAHRLEKGDDGIGTRGKLTFRNPQRLAAGSIIGFQRLGDLRRGAELQIGETFAEIRGVYDTGRIRLVVVIARAGNARQRLGVGSVRTLSCARSRGRGRGDDAGRRQFTAITRDLAGAAAQEVHQRYRPGAAGKSGGNGKTESQHQRCR
ncbi:hypothetical protein D3C72_1235100 [compost metagenome]